MASIERLQKLSVRFFYPKKPEEKSTTVSNLPEAEMWCCTTRMVCCKLWLWRGNPKPSAPMTRHSKESCWSRHIITLPVKSLARIRTGPWIQVSYPNDLMVTITKITCLEEDPVDLVWLLSYSVVQELIVALGEGGGLEGFQGSPLLHQVPCFPKSCLHVQEQSERLGLLDISAFEYQMSTHKAQPQAGHYLGHTGRSVLELLMPVLCHLQPALPLLALHSSQLQPEHLLLLRQPG